MKEKVSFVFLVLACAASLSSCTQKLESFGNAVRFSAHSNGSTTKTQYAGMDGSFEIINWVSGDQIRIYSPEGGGITSSDKSSGFFYADYTLSEIKTSGHISQAGTITPTAGNGISWVDGGGNANFFSVYPSTLAVSASGSKLGATVTIPESQNGSNVISSLPLVAKTATVTNGESVNLDFSPAFSTFEFTIKSSTGSGSLTLNSITLSSEDNSVSGTGTYDIESGTFTPGATQERKATVTFPTPVEVTESKETTFYLFTLPINLSKVTITVNYTKDYTTLEKKLKLQKDSSWLTFTAGHYTRIYGLAVPDTGIRFFLNDVIVDPLTDESHVINY